MAGCILRPEHVVMIDSILLDILAHPECLSSNAMPEPHPVAPSIRIGAAQTGGIFPKLKEKTPMKKSGSKSSKGGKKKGC